MSELSGLILNEVQYLQKCTSNPIAILILNELWPFVADIADDVDYNIWKLPAASTLLFPKIAHMLYELPWREAGEPHSIELKGPDVDVETEFLEAARREQLCIVRSVYDHMPNIRLAIGTAIKNTAGRSNESDAVTIAVPLDKEDFTYIQSKPQIT